MEIVMQTWTPIQSRHNNRPYAAETTLGGIVLRVTELDNSKFIGTWAGEQPVELVGNSLVVAKIHALEMARVKLREATKAVRELQLADLYSAANVVAPVHENPVVAAGRELQAQIFSRRLFAPVA